MFRFKSGFLAENSVTETDQPELTHNAPYARKQYYENNGNGLRGSHWTERMWADRGKEIIQSVAAYCGGKTK